MSYGIKLEVVFDGVMFKNECRKNFYFTGDNDFGKISQIPSLLSETTESLMCLPLRPYNLNIVGLESIAILSDEISGNRYIASLTKNLEVPSNLPTFNADSFKYTLYDKYSGVNLKF